jgi:hypothetical protein
MLEYLQTYRDGSIATKSSYDFSSELAKSIYPAIRSVVTASGHTIEECETFLSFIGRNHKFYLVNRTRLDTKYDTFLWRILEGATPTEARGGGNLSGRRHRSGDWESSKVDFIPEIL